MPLRHALPDQRMLGRTDDPHWFDPDDAGDKLAAFVGMIAKSECHFAAPYQITDLLARCGPQIELDRNRTLSELAQHVDDVGVREGTDQCQRNRPAFLADCRLYCLPPVLDRRQDRLGKRQKGSARLGQAGSAVGPLEQRRTELLLDQTDPTTDRRLRAMQPIGGTGKPAELRDRDKSAYFLDIHVISKADVQGLYYALDISPAPA